MKKLKTGIIGCGTISGIHLDAVKNSPDASLEMVCDIDEARAKAAALKYGCGYTGDLETLLNQDLDVIHILTPHYTHYELAKAVLNRHINCLLEKPMTIHYEDALDLIRLSDHITDAKLGIVFQNRLNTTSQLIKKAVVEKTYGVLKGIRASVTWNRGKDYYAHDAWRGTIKEEGGGVLINQAIHTLDLIVWFGGAVQDISGHYGAYKLGDVIEVEDTAVLFIQFENGAQGMLFATNNNVINSPIEMEIVFENGILLMSDSKLYLKTDGNLRLLGEDVTAKGEKAYWGSSHEELITRFYKSIINDTNDYVSAEEAATTIKILEEFYRQANSGTKINLGGENYYLKH